MDQEKSLEDKRKDGWEDNIREWTELGIRNLTVEDMTRWREIVRTASMAPLRPDGYGNRLQVGSKVAKRQVYY